MCTAVACWRWGRRLDLIDLAMKSLPNCIIFALNSLLKSNTGKRLSIGEMRHWANIQTRIDSIHLQSLRSLNLSSYTLSQSLSCQLQSRLWCNLRCHAINTFPSLRPQPSSSSWPWMGRGEHFEARVLHFVVTGYKRVCQMCNNNMCKCIWVGQESHTPPPPPLSCMHADLYCRPVYILLIHWMQSRPCNNNNTQSNVWHIKDRPVPILFPLG